VAWLGRQFCVASVARLSVWSTRPRDGSMQYVEAAASDVARQP
jgi:hypothetical protein